jgi:hypothetical protein
MTRFTRTLLIASVLALPLGGCATYDTITDSLDPTEWFSNDFFGLGTKKKLPGERRPVFPQGVPGVAKGVPPDMIKGNQVAAVPEEPIIPPEEAKPKPKAKPKPRPKAETVAIQRAPTSITVRRSPEAQQEPPPPAQQQQSGGVQWPDPPAARSPQPAPAGGGVQWPEPPRMR